MEVSCYYAGRARKSNRNKQTAASCIYQNTIGDKVSQHIREIGAFQIFAEIDFESEAK